MKEQSDILTLVAVRLGFFALRIELSWHVVLLPSLRFEAQASDLKWDLKVTQHVAAKFAPLCMPRVRHEVAAEVRDRTAFSGTSLLMLLVLKTPIEVPANTSSASMSLPR